MKFPAYICPGRNGVKFGALDNKIVVISGTFALIASNSSNSSRCSVNLGKNDVRAIVESLGGIVRERVSGKTDILLVGEDPGYEKVTFARSVASLRILSLEVYMYMCVCVYSLEALVSS